MSIPRSLPQDRTKRIAHLNDVARRAMGVASRLIQTAGFCALPAADQSALRERVELFETFTRGNDPYQEHDFGAVEHNGHRVFWKIDYYSRQDSAYGSEDPSDPSKTIRVLTLMLADEY
jgi:hypothetical protein